jgi:hypothetical protein
VAIIPNQEDWIVSASGTKVIFWNTSGVENDANDEDGSSEDEKPKKKRKKSKQSKKSKGASSAFFADLE